MPRTRFPELLQLAEEHDGLLTASQARAAGITSSVLARLTQRGRLERVSRGVYRIPYFPANRYSQYREAVLSTRAARGPRSAALSHATALAVYGISDANPARIHVTVPRRARLRRRPQKTIEIHRANLPLDDVTIHEGLPITTIARTVEDMLSSTGQAALVRQAIAGARREGYIGHAEAQRLTRRVARYVRGVEADATSA